MFYSYAKQDQFVANLLKYKLDGFYIDIGSHHSTVANNTNYFSKNLNWKGVCVELDRSVIESYNQRKNCILLNENAISVDYIEILKTYNFPKTIDYLSLDVDTASLDVLKVLPLSSYNFKVITIEHDAYIHGDKFQKPQQEILLNHNYKLIAENVFVEQEGHSLPMCSFEDWYIHADEFKWDEINYIYSKNAYPSEIINKFIL
jgi:hypothetical protein